MTASSTSHVHDKAVGVWFGAEALTADVARGKHRRRKKGGRERRVGRIKLSHNLCGATDADDLAALLADDGGKHSSWHDDMASLRGSVGRFVDQDELAAYVAASSSGSKFKLQSNTRKPVKIGQTGFVLPSDASMGSFSSQVYPLAEAAVHFPSVDVSPRFTATSAIPHSSSSSTRTLFFPTHIGGVPTWATDMSRLLLGPTTALEGGRCGGNKTCGWHLKPPDNDDIYCLRHLKMMTFISSYVAISSRPSCRARLPCQFHSPRRALPPLLIGELSLLSSPSSLPCHHSLPDAYTAGTRASPCVSGKLPSSSTPPVALRRGVRVRGST